MEQSVGFGFDSICFSSSCSGAGSYRMDTEGLTELHYCTPGEKTCRCSDTCLIHQSQPELGYGRENLCQRQG